MGKTEDGMLDKRCPIVRQFIPFEEKTDGKFHAYWESPDDLQQGFQDKYGQSRIILRMTSACVSYCNKFCFEGVRTMKQKNGVYVNSVKKLSQVCEQYKNKNLQEIILSGGDPLVYKKEKIEAFLKTIRNILGEDILIRINTRAPIFNPWTLEEFTEIFSRYNLNSLGLHIVHPHEIQVELKEEIAKLKRENPQLFVFGQTPLLSGINDEIAVLQELFKKMLHIGIAPKYLYHTMPESIFPSARVPWDRAMDIAKVVCSVEQPSVIRPRFTVVNHDGKFFPSMMGTNYKQFKNRIEYTNWRGEKSTYPI